MRRWLGFGLAGSAFLLGCGALNAIVGGECPDGMILDGDHCILLPPSDASVDGSAQGDATVSDGALADGADGSTADGSSSDGSSSDGSSSDASTDGADLDADPDAASEGGSLCEGDLIYCAGKCRDFMTDPYHCGSCGYQCSTLLCSGGVCQGSLNGHVVLVGHDYSGATSLSQQRVLANAALLANGSVIRVRSWEQYADPTAVNVVRGAISAAASAQNRSVLFAQAMVPADVLATTTATTDVLVLHDQPNAPPATLGALGASFAATLALYTQNGGIVVITDGGGGAAPQMSQLVKASGLLDVTAETGIAFGTSLLVAAPADAVGLGVLSPYAAGQRSVFFTSSEPANRFIVVDPSAGDGGAEPVVIHRVVP